MAVRYIVSDVDRAVRFYCDLLGFVLERQYGSAMAVLERDGTRLWLAGPLSSAARPMPDGRTPTAGGWNRIVVEVSDLDAAIGQLRSAGVVFRNEIVAGPGGRQVLIEDDYGNPVEVFQPAA